MLYSLLQDLINQIIMAPMEQFRAAFWAVYMDILSLLQESLR